MTTKKVTPSACTSSACAMLARGRELLLLDPLFLVGVCRPLIGRAVVGLLFLGSIRGFALARSAWIPVFVSSRVVGGGGRR